MSLSDLLRQSQIKGGYMKKLLFIASIFLFAASVFALEVNEPELKVTGNETVEFINYTGPHKVIDSLEAIKRIGSDMGKTIVPDHRLETKTSIMLSMQ